MSAQDDIRFMRRALQLARHGQGHASPNPLVGAVIVRDGLIIGEGFHRRCGQGHAEVNAVAAVSDPALLRGATIYVTLEPCSHQGRTPPCARLLIGQGLGRVVVGTLDPFHLVSGRGVAMLREAGIAVTVGVLEDECRQLNRRFMTAHRLRRPWVQLKWAQSADGYLAVTDGEAPLRLSTPVTMALMHRERSLADAIVVGANTVRADNPSLTTRRWPGSSPLRVVLDHRLSSPPESRLFTDGQATVVYNSVRSGVTGAVTLVKVDDTSPAVWLADLYSRGITSVMVEGGTCVLRQMLDSGLWDEARVEVASRRVGRGIAAPAVDLAAACRQIIDGNLIYTIDNRTER